MLQTHTAQVGAITFTFQNTLRCDIRFRVMQQRFVDEAAADAHIFTDFCWMVAHVASVEGTEWQPVDETATPEEFEACYLAFADLGTAEWFYEVVGEVNVMKRPLADVVEKPDAALTEAEAADPN